MTTITRTAFVELVKTMNRSTPVGVTTLTEPKMRKTGNAYAGNCQRLARRNGFIGVNYENCANNILERLGFNRDFESGPLPWGEHDGRYFITHKGQHYLKLYPVPGTLEDRWQENDGTLIDKADIEEYLYSSTPPVMVEVEMVVDGETVTVEMNARCPWRTVRLDHLLTCNVAGEQYTLTN